MTIEMQDVIEAARALVEAEMPHSAQILQELAETHGPRSWSVGDFSRNVVQGMRYGEGAHKYTVEPAKVDRARDLVEALSRPKKAEAS